MRFERIRAKGLGPFRGEIDVDLTAMAGPLVAVTGANGAGKSTLLELICAGMYRKTPTRGALAGLATGRDSFVELTAVNGRTWTMRHLVDAVSLKSESTIIDDVGQSVLSDSKVRSFDAWGEKHLPPESVLFTSSFAAQGSGGFLEMKPGDRKGVLLRVLGIEKYEALAAGAREHAREAKATLATLEALLVEEKRRGGDPAVILQTLHEHQAAATALIAEADRCRETLAELRVAHATWTTRRSKALDLLAERRKLTAEIQGLEERVRNNRRVLESADNIRGAQHSEKRLVEEIAAARADLDATRAASFEADKEVGRLLSDASATERTIASLEAQMGALEQRTMNIDAARLASTRLDDLNIKIKAEVDEIGYCRGRIEAIRNDAAEYAAGRITKLREGLETIASDPDTGGGNEIARHTLDADNDAAERVELAPDEIASIGNTLKAAEKRLDELNALFEASNRLFHSLPALEQAVGELEAARTESVKLHEFLTITTDTLKTIAEPKAAETSAAVSRNITRVQDLQSQHNALKPMLAKVEPLTQAEARLAELEPQIKLANDRLAEITASLAECDGSEDEPQVGRAETALRDHEENYRRIVAAVAVSESQYETATASAAKVAEHEATRAAKEAELADWQRLADDFGRDGIQSLEIDAAGPELTELVNDLLRTCVGSRWTVTIEASKASADGKKLLEGCEVRVLDTVGGREGAAETFSGGERVLLSEAISLALCMLSCRRSGVKGATIVRDESGAALDPVNGRKYIAMLRRAADIVGASQVLFVSHSVELAELADSRIVVANGQVTS